MGFRLTRASWFLNRFLKGVNKVHRMDSAAYERGLSEDDNVRDLGANGILPCCGGICYISVSLAGTRKVSYMLLSEGTAPSIWEISALSPLEK